MNVGKKRRLRKIFSHEIDNTIIVPMDHGITLGPIKGLVTIKDTVKELIQGEIDGIILHKGMINACEEELVNTDIATIMHLSASTALSPNPTYKTIVGDVFEAVSLGCDAVSLHINIGGKDESKMLSEAASISSKCYKYGMPLIAMMYARGENIENEKEIKFIEHIARVAAEIGADIVKVNYCGDPELFKQVVKGCPVPVIIAGGEKMVAETDFLREIDQAMYSGIKGISVGRNIFQSENISTLLHALHKIVHLREPIERVLDELNYSREMDLQWGGIKNGRKKVGT